MQRKKSTIKITDKQSLESLMQETYYDACGIKYKYMRHKITTSLSHPETQDGFLSIILLMHHIFYISLF